MDTELLMRVIHNFHYDLSSLYIYDTFITYLLYSVCNHHLSTPYHAAPSAVRRKAFSPTYFAVINVFINLLVLNRSWYLIIELSSLFPFEHKRKASSI